MCMICFLKSANPIFLGTDISIRSGLFLFIVDPFTAQGELMHYPMMMMMMMMMYWLSWPQYSWYNLSVNYLTVMYLLIIIAPACSRVRYRRPIFCPSVRPSVRQSVRLSTFMSTFDIYVKVSILINYKTKQPPNLAWNISLTSWLCNIGVRFSVCLSIRPSVCQHLCRSSTFMSKLVF